MRRGWVGILAFGALAFLGTEVVWAAMLENRFVLVDGEVTVEKSTVILASPKPGQKIQTNAFGQYRGNGDGGHFSLNEASSSAASAKAGQAVQEGDVIRTGRLSFAKLLIADGTIVDLGPESIFSFVTKAHFKLPQGRLRLVVTRPVTDSAKFLLEIPSAKVHVRKGAFSTEALFRAGAGGSEILGIKGQLSVDTAKLNDSGLVYFHPYVVGPYRYLAVSGPVGLSTEKLDFRTLEAKEFITKVEEMAAKVNLYATEIGKPPSLAKTIGTAVGPKNGDGGLFFMQQGFDANPASPRHQSFFSPLESSAHPKIAAETQSKAQVDFRRERKLYFTIDQGFSFQWVKQTGFPQTMQTALHSDIAGNFAIGRRFAAAALVGIDALPLRLQQGIYNSPVFSTELRLSASVPAFEKWHFAFGPGLFYSNTITETDIIGFKDWIGPEFFVSAKHQFDRRNSLAATFFYAPTLSLKENTSFSIHNWVVGLGASFNHALNNAHLLRANISLRTAAFETKPAQSAAPAFDDRTEFDWSQIVVSLGYGL